MGIDANRQRLVGRKARLGRLAVAGGAIATALGRALTIGFDRSGAQGARLSARFLLGVGEEFARAVVTLVAGRPARPRTQLLGDRQVDGRAAMFNRLPELLGVGGLATVVGAIAALTLVSGLWAAPRSPPRSADAARCLDLQVS